MYKAEAYLSYNNSSTILNLTLPSCIINSRSRELSETPKLIYSKASQSRSNNIYFYRPETTFRTDFRS